jgi:hypothetical protein
MTLAQARTTMAAAAVTVAVLASCVTTTHTTDSPIPTGSPVAASLETIMTTPKPTVPSITASPQPVATTTPVADSLAPVAPQILGAWETQTWLDQSGSQAIVRTYRFMPDATYDYQIALCRSSTDCAIQSSESGYFQTAGGVLSLMPKTDPSDGPRAYPYVIGRDPDVGDIQLHLTLPDGELDIFYFSP